VTSEFPSDEYVLLSLEMKAGLFFLLGSASFLLSFLFDLKLPVWFACPCCLRKPGILSPYWICS
jgi:hypothetical protein